MTTGTFRVESLGQRGDGIVRTDGKVIHVAKVLTGETIALRDGALATIVNPSPERVAPFCNAFERCGGCKLQHWNEAQYRPWKWSLVDDALRASGLETEVAELVDAHGAGRRRASLHVREISSNWSAGFMAEGTHTLQPLDHCPILVSQLADATKIAASFGPVLGPCDVAITASLNGLDVNVKAERKAVEKRLSVLKAIFESHRLCRLSVNGESLFSLGSPVVAMGAVQVQLPVQSFLQATEAGEQALARTVRAILHKSRNIADLFCGLGPFTLNLAETAKVSAADADKPAISCLQTAVRNAKGLKPITAETRDLFRNPFVVSELKEFDGVVLDPPRAGALAQVQMLAKSQVKRIASVSCDLTTFIRDAQVLTAGGYKLKKVTPIDQFKWTHHVELVGAFVK